MSNELAEIFILFIFGLIFASISWWSWTQNEVTYRSRRYRREDSPFAFWAYISFTVLSALLFIVMGIIFSISLLRSSWRTVESSPRGHGLEAARLVRLPFFIRPTAAHPRFTQRLFTGDSHPVKSLKPAA